MEVGRPCRLCSPAVTFSHFTWRQTHIETGGGRKGGRKGGLASRSAGCVSSQTSGKQSVGGGGKFSGGGGGGPARPTAAFVVLRAATPATPPSL